MNNPSINYGHCFYCGELAYLGESDDMCDDCYEQKRWEEISAINCNPQVDEIDGDETIDTDTRRA
jgi:hypothetical protein